MYIKKCPVCGKPPLAYNGYQSESEGWVQYELWHVACNNPKCPVSIEAVGIDKKTAVAKWNTRYNPRKRKKKNENGN